MPVLWASKTRRRTHERIGLQQGGRVRRIPVPNSVHPPKHRVFKLIQALFQRYTDGGVAEQTTTDVGGSSGRWRRVVILPLGKNMLVPQSGPFLSALCSSSFHHLFLSLHLQSSSCNFLQPSFFLLTCALYSGTCNLTLMNTSN